MTITRNEFKELVHLYRETWHKSTQMINYYNEEVVNEMLFTALDWITEKLGIRNEDEELDVIMDLIIFGNVPINPRAIGEDEDGEEIIDCEWTDDLDKIYDYYFKESQCL